MNANERFAARPSAMIAGGLLAAAGLAIATASGSAQPEGNPLVPAPLAAAPSAPAPAMIAIPDNGFAVITGANGRYFHIGENGKARAVSTDAGEFINWK